MGHGGLTRREALGAGVGATAVALAGQGTALAAGSAARRRARAPHALGFETLEREVVLPRLPVQGDLPPWLRGTLVRNGPGRFEVGEHAFRHWFDGLAMLHAFSFRQGRVSYANRFLRGSQFLESRKDGKIHFQEFATDPCRDLFKGTQSVLAPLAPVPNANVSVARLAGRFVALTELPMPVRFDPRTLRTLGVDAPGKLGDLQTAHPHVETRTGDAVAYEVSLVPPAEYRVVRIPGRRGAEPQVVARIPTDHPSYMHSFALTQRHVVLTEAPLRIDVASLIATGKPIAEQFRWSPAQPTRFHVLDRRTGERRAVLETDGFFTFHHVNAFDRGDEVVVDACTYRDGSVIDAFYLDRLRRPQGQARAPRATVERFTLRPAKGTVGRETLGGGVNLELPRIREDRDARAYRYAYGIHLRSRASAFVDAVVKLDTQTGERRVWAPPGGFPGEPIFVPEPQGRREDDGVLLTVVLDAARKASSLVCLDARTMAERARAEVPHHIPFGFHGSLVLP